jgi:hypothetical protein
MPYYRQAKLSFKETTKLCAQYFWCGIKDAFAWPSSLITIYGYGQLLRLGSHFLIFNKIIIFYHLIKVKNDPESYTKLFNFKRIYFFRQYIFF